VVLVGTNNEAVRDPKQSGDRGVLMAFREATGEFMWQATYEKLSSGRANDWPFQGIASSPLVLDDIAYFTSNRGGSPQIYRIPAGGGDATRVTFQGEYNVSPRISPDGKTLVFLSRNSGRDQLSAMDLATRQIQVLTDPASTVGAHAVRTRTAGIVEGDPRGTMRLKYMARDGGGIQVGDLVVTSGSGGVFPRGIPVGVVRAIDDRGPANDGALVTQGD
jgi:hypothetical protein